MENHGVRLEISDDRVDVVLCEPERRNAQSPGMWDFFAHIEQYIPSSARVIVVRAEGPSFSAGLDRAMMTPEGIPGQGSFFDLAGESPHRLDSFIAQAQKGFTWWSQQPVITIAAVQGHAIGAGMQLALACDLIIAQDDALFAMRETSLGLVPDLGGTRELVSRVGYPRALEICATGRFVDAQEAVNMGLAQYSAPVGELMTRTNDLISQLATAPLGALHDLKPLLRHAMSATQEEQLAAERAAQIRRFGDLAKFLQPS
jgi:enoyl-CoA hydratase/carnithine racemase